MSTDPIEWLRAQIQVRKAAAMAATSGPWSIAWYERTDEPHEPENRLTKARITAPDAVDPEGGRWVTPDVARDLTDADAEHIMLNDPRDTIARCDAELATIDEHGPPSSRQQGYACASGCLDRETLLTQEAPCHTVRLLAQGYRHRDGYPFEDSP